MVIVMRSECWLPSLEVRSCQISNVETQLAGPLCPQGPSHPARPSAEAEPPRESSWVGRAGLVQSPRHREGAPGFGAALSRNS